MQGKGRGIKRKQRHWSLWKTGCFTNHSLKEQDGRGRKGASRARGGKELQGRQALTYSVGGFYQTRGLIGAQLRMGKHQALIKDVGGL